MDGCDAQVGQAGRDRGGGGGAARGCRRLRRLLLAHGSLHAEHRRRLRPGRLHDRGAQGLGLRRPGAGRGQPAGEGRPDPGTDRRPRLQDRARPGALGGGERPGGHRQHRRPDQPAADPDRPGAGLARVRPRRARLRPAGPAALRHAEPGGLRFRAAVAAGRRDLPPEDRGRAGRRGGGGGVAEADRGAAQPAPEGRDRARAQPGGRAAGRAEPGLHDDIRPGRRGGGPAQPAGRPVRPGRDPADGGGAAAVGLRGRELQGDAAHPRAARRGGRGRDRHLPRRRAEGARRQPGPGQRADLRPPAARQRHRQLHQGCPAHPRQDRARRRPEARRPAATRHVGRADHRHPRPAGRERPGRPGRGRQLRPLDRRSDAMLATKLPEAGPRNAPASTSAPRPAMRVVAPVDEVSLKTWLAVGASIIGAFMAVLNIQITNASLPDIQGAIGAGIDDGGWISTSYLVAEIVTIPLTGYLSRVFSLRRYLLANTLLFLIFSVACAFASSLGEMIVLRAIQGFAGGVLIPMAFTIIITMLPKARQPMGLAMFALSATFAPAIGPTIGGYLTENWGWQYVFYINLVPGALMLTGLWLGLEPSPMRLDLLRQGDWTGIATMAIGLSALQTVLEEGNKDDWFGSPFITRLSIVAAVALALFAWIELTKERPLLNLRLLTGRNFGFATLSNFMLGTALYGSVFLLPLYLSQMHGYNAEQVGMVLAWTGLPQLVLIPLVPTLMKRVDSRLLITVALGLFAASSFLDVHLDGNFAGPELFWPNLVRAVGQALVMTPLSALATSGIDPKEAGSASALFNMTRNLGGAIGIAALQTFLTKREQFHSNIIMAHVTPFAEATRDRMDSLQAYFLAHGATDPGQAWHEAVVQVGRTVRAQAYFLAYGDAFALLGAGLVIALLAAFLLRKPASTAGAAGAH